MRLAQYGAVECYPWSDNTMPQLSRSVQKHSALDERRLKRDRALEEENRVAGDDHPLSAILAEKDAAPLRELMADEPALAQALGPVGDQAAMRDPRGRILGNAVRRRE